MPQHGQPAGGDRQTVQTDRETGKGDKGDKSPVETAELPLGQPGRGSCTGAGCMGSSSNWGGGFPQEGPDSFQPDPTWLLRTFLMNVYYAQSELWQRERRYSGEWAELGIRPPPGDLVMRPMLEKTQVTFIASGDVVVRSGLRVRCYVDEQSRLTCADKDVN